MIAIITKPPQEEIIYKYVPMTFQEEQNNPEKPSVIFKSMFDKASPWINSINDMYFQHKKEVNKYFISQQ